LVLHGESFASADTALAHWVTAFAAARTARSLRHLLIAFVINTPLFAVPVTAGFMTRIMEEV
jgi:hypothetical protein